MRIRLYDTYEDHSAVDLKPLRFGTMPQGVEVIELFDGASHQQPVFVEFGNVNIGPRCTRSARSGLSADREP